MKIKINNLVELVNALEEHGRLYCVGGEALVFSSQHRGVDVIEDTGSKGLDLRGFPWGTEFDTNPQLEDKQPVWCWGVDYTASREARFYDIKNNATFSHDGFRDGISFRHYEPVKLNEDGSFPECLSWMEDAKKKLED